MFEINNKSKSRSRMHFWWALDLVLLNGIKLYHEEWILIYSHCHILGLWQPSPDALWPGGCWVIRGVWDPPRYVCVIRAWGLSVSPRAELKFSQVHSWLHILKMFQSSGSWIFNFIFYLFIYLSIHSTLICWNSPMTQTHLVREAENWTRKYKGLRKYEDGGCAGWQGPKGAPREVSEETG